MKLNKTSWFIFGTGVVLFLIFLFFQLSRTKFGAFEGYLQSKGVVRDTGRLYHNSRAGVEFALRPQWTLDENTSYQGSKRMTLLTIWADSSSPESAVTNVRLTDVGWMGFTPIYRAYQLREGTPRSILIAGTNALRFHVVGTHAHYARLEREEIIYEFTGNSVMLDSIFSSLTWTQKSAPTDSVLTFRRTPPLNLPNDVARWLENCLKLDLEAFSLTKEHGEKTYMFVTSGRRPTGGYRVEIIEVVNRDAEEVLVRTRFSRPDPDQIVTQSLSTPYDVVELEHRALPVRVIPEGNDAPRRIASLAGINELPPIVAESRGIKVFSPAPSQGVGSLLRVRGVASTTEGTMYFRLLDQKGNRLLNGDVTTARSLDWGYFAAQVSVPKNFNKRGTLVLELYLLDESNAEETDVVSIPLRFNPADER